METFGKLPEDVIIDMEKGIIDIGGSLHHILGKDAIPALQGMMAANAEKDIPLSTNFIALNDERFGGKSHSMRIINIKTRAYLIVGLCDYRGARKALAFYEALDRDDDDGIFWVNPKLNLK